MASRLDPGTITVLKGNKPLCLHIHRQHRVVLYASEPAFIDFAVGLCIPVKPATDSG